MQNSTKNRAMLHRTKDILTGYPFNKNKKQRVAEQVQIILDLFGGEIIQGGRTL